MKIKKDSNNPNPFGDRLRQLRQARGLTQIELGKLTGLSQRMIGYYETHAKFPPANFIGPMAKALKVSTDELLGVKTFKDDTLPKNLMRRFRSIHDMPLRDQRAVFALINALKGKQAPKNKQ